MMAPYAIGHLKMSFLLEELGCPLSDEERFQLYLTNTLTMEEIYFNDIPGLSSLSEESTAASKVKQKNILVIMGNPPYSGVSANQNDWTEQLLKTDMDGAQSYYVVDGQSLGEKKVWLQDDYVKFLRFAQWKVQHAGEGVVGMITNHGYLDNPTFRGMRQSLMKTFNEIFVLDLHGNSLKKEIAPDGGKDENIFDIRQGVAIILLVKMRGREGCVVNHKNLYGERKIKYDWLETHDETNSEFIETYPNTPWYLFGQKRTDNIELYEKSPKISKIFPKFVTGIVTARDNFVIGFSEKEILSRISQFRDLSLSDEIIQSAFPLKDTRGWKISLARKKLLLIKNGGSIQKRYCIDHSINDIFITHLIWSIGADLSSCVICFVVII
jgi:predicted helicase